MKKYMLWTASGNTLPILICLICKVQRRSYRQRIAAIIEEGIRKGEIKNIDAPTAVLIMLHAVSGIESWHRSVKRIGSEMLEDNMVMILVEGLKK
jgi:hypothetical protein